MLEILIENQDNLREYDAFVEVAGGSFMQASAWAAVKRDWGHAFLLSRGEDGQIRGAMLVLHKKVPRLGVSLLYAPRGPVCDPRDSESLGDLIAGARQIARQCRGYLLKIDPPVQDGDGEAIGALCAAGFRHLRNQGLHDAIQTRHNYSIRGVGAMGRDGFLKHVGLDTRYKMRLPGKKGVICEVIGPERFEEFYEVYSETGGRQHFTVRSRDYLRNFCAAFGDRARIYLCSFEGTPLCGGIAVNCGGTVSHVYGGSTDRMREKRATYLLQWEMANWAIDSGCHTYDMMGISLDPRESEALFGVYEFKRSFNGEVVTYAGEFDLVLRPFWYLLLSLARKIIRIR